MKAPFEVGDLVVAVLNPSVVYYPNELKLLNKVCIVTDIEELGPMEKILFTKSTHKMRTTLHPAPDWYNSRSFRLYEPPKPETRKVVFENNTDLPITILPDAVRKLVSAAFE